MFARITPVVKNLLIINIALLAIEGIIGINLSNWLALYYVNSEMFAPYQFFTYMFLHANFMHLFSNMLGLFFFGPALEDYFGPKRFLIFYIACGIGGGLFYAGSEYLEKHPIEVLAIEFQHKPTPANYSAFIAKVQKRYGWVDRSNIEQNLHQHPNNEQYISRAVSNVRNIISEIANIPMVGASGAVLGILMAFGLLFPNTNIYLLLFPVPIKAKYLVLAYGTYTIIQGFSQTPGDNVAHLAHLGGMVVAIVLIKVWQKQHP